MSVEILTSIFEKMTKDAGEGVIIHNGKTTLVKFLVARAAALELCEKDGHTILRVFGANASIYGEVIADVKKQMPPNLPQTSLAICYPPDTFLVAATLSSNSPGTPTIYKENMRVMCKEILAVLGEIFDLL